MIKVVANPKVTKLVKFYKKVQEINKRVYGNQEATTKPRTRKLQD